MIRAALEEPPALAGLRASFRPAPLRALFLRDAVEPAGAAGLRVRLAAAGFAPYWVADRGRYERSELEELDHSLGLIELLLERQV